MFAERFFTDDTKANFNPAALDVGIPIADNFNKVLSKMTKHTFPAYTFPEQMRYIHRHLAKLRSMKLCNFIHRLQELNIYLEEFHPDKERQESAPLPADEIIDSIYHSIPTTWKNKMIEQGCNYADCTIKEMTDFFETGVENLEPKEEKKKSFAAAKKTNKKNFKKLIREDSDSSVVESNEEFTIERRPNMKYCILRGKYIYSTDNCKNLCALINKHKQKKKKS